MSKMNLLVYLNTYTDACASNAPSLSNFKWSREINAISAINPISEAFDLAPGESKNLFSGTRTLLSDNTTVWNIALKPLSTHTYVISATAGLLPNFRTPRSIASLATTEVTAVTNGPIVTYSAPATSAGATATFTGQVAGMTTDVTLDADNEGANGNDIILVGDGTSTLVELADAWNLANPTNEVVQDIGDFSQVPDLGANIQLSGGVDAVGGWNLAAVVVGDNVRIGDEFNQLNQGEFKIIAKTAQSFTVENYTGVNETVTLGAGFAEQIQIYSAAGVQVGDTVVIPNGFSAVTQGSYKVTGVGANFIEIYSTALLPQETAISPVALAVYSSAKTFLYLESNQKVSITVNGTIVANLEPFIVNAAAKPGIFMLRSTVYSLDIQNNSTDTASLFMATVE